MDICIKYNDANVELVTVHANRYYCIKRLIYYSSYIYIATLSCIEDRHYMCSFPDIRHCTIYIAQKVHENLHMGRNSAHYRSCDMTLINCILTFQGWHASKYN